MSSSLLIPSFPLSPSVNKCYFNLPRGGRASTQVLKDYKQACSMWAIQNQQTILTFKHLMQNDWSHINPEKKLNSVGGLKLDLYFTFKRERLITKDGRLKKLDCNNFSKAAIDCLSDILGIDDSIFIGHYLEKITGEKESIICFITPVSMLSSIEVIQNFSEQAPESSENIQ